MDSYTKVIYPEDGANRYPAKLCCYLWDRFFNKKSSIKMLDIGCGKGTHLREFSKLGMDCSGVDIRDEQTEFVVKVCNVGVDVLPYNDNSFDFVFSKSSIQHIQDTDNLLKNVYRILKPGGVLVVLTPDWESQYKFFWDDYTHVKAFTRKSLRDAFKINGFFEVGCDYFYQLPFLWGRDYLSFLPKVFSFFPDFLKWKTSEHRNTQDRKLIRFSKERMLLAYGKKGY